MPIIKGNADYQHDSSAPIGILLTNLGTPSATTPKAVRKYLAEFLSDSRVIETPKFIWWLILHGIILRTRPTKSAKAYQKVWMEEGSPLLVYSQRQAQKLRNNLTQRYGASIQVELAMCYGKPSIQEGLERLRQANINRLLLFPLYPQYSATTTAATFDKVVAVLKTWRALPEFRMIQHYHDNSGYITALADKIKTHWIVHSKPGQLIFSFHGLPKHYFLAGDPYHCECHKTARLVAEQLELQPTEWQVSFQSRFGPRAWLQPYTDKLLIKLAKSRVKHVQIICPGFSADCLETLEEINIQNREFFLGNGGDRFSYIPALNDDETHIHALSQIIETHCQGWQMEETDEEKVQRLQRAKNLSKKQ